MHEIKPQKWLWLKAILYRIVRILIVLFSAWFISGDIESAGIIATFDAILATLFYYYFDIVWCKIEEYLNKWHLKWKYRKLG